MIKAIIVEDEPKNATYLEAMISSKIPELVVKGMAANVKDGIALIEKEQPDIVLLDVELQNETGFDLLSQLHEISFSIIFTTAFEHYALRAIKFAALDYLLKPVDENELRSAIHKVSRFRDADRSGGNVKVLLDNMSQLHPMSRIAIPSQSGMVMLELNHIVYLRSDGAYTHIITDSGEKIMSSRHLKEYEDLLSGNGFARVHKSFLVKLSKIRAYNKSEGGFLTMSNGDRAEVSEKKRDELVSRLASDVIFLK